MKIVIIADQHGRLPDIEPCDLLLIAGDICPIFNHDIMFQRLWLNTNFRTWLEKVPAKHVVAIAGNHDFIFERTPDYVPALPWLYLQNTWVEVNGVKIWGSPVTPRFHDWAFNADPPELERLWATIPDDVNILITHGPPHGYGDLVPERGTFIHVGCKALMSRIQQLPNLLLHCCGHIHNNHGCDNYGVRQINHVTLVNASLATDHAGWANGPVVLDLEGLAVSASSTRGP